MLLNPPQRKARFASKLSSVFPVLQVLGYPVLALALLQLGEPDGRTASIIYRFSLAILAVAVFTVSSKKLTKSTARLAIWALGIFYLCYALRIVIDSELLQLSLPRSTVEYLAYFLLFTMLPTLAAFTTYDSAAARLSAVLMMWASIPVIVLAYLFFSNLIFVEFVAIYRLGVESINPIALGHVGGSIVLLATYALQSRAKIVLAESVPALTRIFATGLLLAGASLLILSASKGPVVAVFFAAALMVSQPLSAKSLFKTILLGSLGLGLFILLAMIASDWLRIDGLSRFSRAFADPFADVTTNIRITMYMGALNQFFDSPLWGDALLERWSGFYPHNLFIEALMTTGIFASLAYFYFIYVGIVSACKLMGGTGEFSLIGALAIQSLLTYMFSGSILTSGQVSYFFVLAIVIADRLQPTRRSGQSQQFRRSKRLWTLSPR